MPVIIRHTDVPMEDVAVQTLLAPEDRVFKLTVHQRRARVREENILFEVAMQKEIPSQQCNEEVISF